MPIYLWRAMPVQREVDSTMTQCLDSDHGQAADAVHGSESFTDYGNHPAAVSGLQNQVAVMSHLHVSDQGP